MILKTKYKCYICEKGTKFLKGFFTFCTSFVILVCSLNLYRMIEVINEKFLNFFTLQHGDSNPGLQSERPAPYPLYQNGSADRIS